MKLLSYVSWILSTTPRLIFGHYIGRNDVDKECDWYFVQSPELIQHLDYLNKLNMENNSDFFYEV